MPSHKITRQLDDGTGALLANSETVTNGAALTVNEAIPNPSTNMQLTFSFTKAKLKSIWISCDQALTIKTNSSSAPQETIVLTAGEPYMWTTGGYFANPFAGDVTTLYVTNASGVTANLTIRGIYDPAT